MRILVLGSYFAVALLITGVKFELVPQQFVTAHFQVLISLPIAAICALAAVVFLERAKGTIELSGFGVKLKGTAGEVVTWAVSFIVIVIAIKLLW